MEWLLVGIFYTSYNSHEVLYKFSSKKECEQVKTILTRNGSFDAGLNNKSECIQIHKIKDN